MKKIPLLDVPAKNALIRDAIPGKFSRFKFKMADGATRSAAGSAAGSGSVAGSGVKDYPYAQCANLSAEMAPPLCRNSTPDEVDPLLERTVSLLVPLIFGVIVIVGLFGNALVVLVVTANQQMRSTTNLLIINLAVADLLFIVFCVPFTATDYALPCWPFGDIWCKVVQYLIVVTSMASVYTLVLMSLDRYLAVVFPIKSMSIRTECNALIAIAVMWVIIVVTSIPAYRGHDVVYYMYENVNKSSCVFWDTSSQHQFAYQLEFFLKAYVVPLLLTAGLYLLMLLRLWRGVAPGGRLSAESRRGKKRVTRMVLVVVAIFALCWAPIQVILLLKSMQLWGLTTFSVSLQIVGQILAYMNSCVNPILYAYLSENFRKAFRKVMSCGPLQLNAGADQRNGRNGTGCGPSICPDRPTRTTRTNGSGFDVL